MKRTILGAALLLISFGLGAVSPVISDDTQEIKPLTAEQKIYGFSNFWREVSYNFAHWETAGDLDWDKAYQDFLPRIIATNNDYEFYRELQLFCALLKDGHTDITFPAGLLKKYIGRIPIQLRELEKRAIVSNVDGLLGDQIPLGSELLEIDGQTVQQMVIKDIIPYISTSAPHMYWEMAIRSWRGVGAGVLFGAKGSVAHLKIQKPDGEVFSIDVPRDQYDRKINWSVKRPKRPLSEFRMLDGNVAYIALNSFSNSEIVDEFRAKLPELTAASGVIIDLRKNGGGNSGNSSKIVGHLTDKPFTGSAWKTPKHYGAYKAWGRVADKYESLEKYRDYYFGHAYHEVEASEHQPSQGLKITSPVIVLVSRSTGSAAEDFLIMADGLDHVSYVGEPSFGSTGQPLNMDLPGGGSARISTKRDFYPDGREFIGIGVVPDIIIKETVADLRSGTDIVLDKALEVLEMKNQQ